LQKDVENLEKLFESLNIKTEVPRDRYVDPVEAAKKFCKDDELADASMSVFVLMGHGNDNSVIYTANGKPIRTDDIIDLFDDKSCPNLKGKPKWFIFQVLKKHFFHGIKIY